MYLKIMIGVVAAIAAISGSTIVLGAPNSIDRSCNASDATSFSVCVEGANHNEVDHIVLTGLIRCGSDSPCDYLLSGITRPLSIIDGSDGAGFSRRADGREKFGLHVEKSSGPITIRGLHFDMGHSVATGKPGDVWIDSACPSKDSCPSEAIAISNSANVLIDQVEFDNAKLFGVSISGSSNITIRRSSFLRSGLHGIWVAQAPASRGLHIENNRFIDIRSNGVMLSSSAPDASDIVGINTVTGNLFDHNHNAAVYHTCGRSGDRPCAGGEIDIEQPSDSLLIADNEFRHGRLDEDSSLADSLHVVGIEIAPTGIRNIIIRNNYFHDLSGGGIAIDAPNVEPQVKVIDNTFERIKGQDPEIGQVSLIGENRGNLECGLGSCNWKPPSGRLSSKQCSLPQEKKCHTTIGWQVANAKEPLRIIVDGQRVFMKAGPMTGEQMADWITEKPARFDLYAGSTLLDTVELRNSQK